jgi:hypothetical protein
MSAEPSTPSGFDAAIASHLVQAELARRWRISPRTLERWRGACTGPAWIQLNGRVLYRLEDITSFERGRLRGA